ncbi:hypothetical protein [Spiroplasma ixodetis]|uniref:Transposase n=1 Tax=Spiroplasma ixodetis TaxID=2141 RepID=A0ABN7BWM4_9MOLU
MNEDLVYIDESGIDDNEFYKYGWSEKGKRLFDNKPRLFKNLCIFLQSY